MGGEGKGDKDGEGKGEGKDDKQCGLLKYKGDGNCDDENNNKGCEYDGGDCCPKTVDGGEVSKKYCSRCACVDPDNQDKDHGKGGDYGDKGGKGDHGDKGGKGDHGGKGGKGDYGDYGGKGDKSDYYSKGGKGGYGKRRRQLDGKDMGDKKDMQKKKEDMKGDMKDKYADKK